MPEVKTKKTMQIAYRILMLPPIIATHISLAKIGHMAMPKFRGRGKVQFSHLPGSPKYLANSLNDYHRVATNGCWMQSTITCTGRRLKETNTTQR